MTPPIPPLVFDWNGEAMVPIMARLADRYYVVGQQYRLVPEEERSTNSHNHYFAALDECWRNLPEEAMLEYPTLEQFRKKLLIRAGYHEARDHVCTTKAEAQRLAAFIRPMDEYAIVIARDNVVRVYTAKSQSRRAMGRKVFQESKVKVLELAASMIGVTAEQAIQNAKRVA